jgi:hypothetical protein
LVAIKWLDYNIDFHLITGSPAKGIDITGKEATDAGCRYFFIVDRK